jgi:hypothetical protein
VVKELLFIGHLSLQGGSHIPAGRKFEFSFLQILVESNRNLLKDEEDRHRCNEFTGAIFM